MDFPIPSKHDAPPKMLWWEFDQAMIFMGGTVFGILSGFLFLGVVVGVWGVRWYGKKKAGKHKFYVVHIMYWFLPSEWVFSFPSLPPSSTREFIG
ncbi:type IV conjugative transfer system protein TraL [Massilia sp. CCM 8734]|uniref:type IV conjugative transfer system protein TraL n=1 Tax=Massilia sp. CCM 8734 TaxID=2609283 RepID=UPI00141FD45C|nr:type IV conjugative transfer system protein TraL [Massilia sp. CCM 8734]NHZ99063.1 type IV conjugative transfer system protein TraL [Massilia sp. CCM 8734]